MKKFIKTFCVLALSTILLTSASVPHSDPTPADLKSEKMFVAIDAAKADGNISNAELRNIATLAKGEKLSLKEKVVLTIFGKKIKAKINDISTTTADGKSQLTAVLLCFFLGGLGIHRFYLGYTWQGIVQLLTLGGLGIWSLIDFIRILTGSLKPKDGEYGKTL